MAFDILQYCPEQDGRAGAPELIDENGRAIVELGPPKILGGYPMDCC